MFIPRGKTVHENLATSYVQVDALVADLGEGGFSGVVEVVLRDTDSFVVICGGRIAAVLEKRGPEYTEGERVQPAVEWDPGVAAYTRTTLAKLAERSRLERGRVSIYGYSGETASIVARRLKAESLYVGLSTDFTDLEKMILKLVRERDREWFVDINTQGMPTALVHLRDGDCRILNSEELTPDEDSDSLDSANNKALGKLLYECNQAGTTFDVYFSRAGEAAEAEVEPEPHLAEVEPAPISDSCSVEILAKGAHVSAQPGSTERQGSGPLPPTDTEPNKDEWDLAPLDLIVNEPYRVEQIEDRYNVRAVTANHPGFETGAEITSPREASALDSGWNLIGVEAVESSERQQVIPSPADPDAMSEVKQLMGAIARTIEEAAQAVDRPESFSMSLRAGQLKIADRYPFLDPFAGEIEYLTGEIVFVGQATVEDFISGLTEALKLAVEAVMKSTAYPERFRAYMTEDLRNLLARERLSLERLRLDKTIEQIIHS